MRIVLILALILSTCIFVEARPKPMQIDSLAWLAGSWHSEDRALEEHWTAPAGGTMLASSRMVKDGRTVHKEFMLVEQDERGLALTVILPAMRTIAFRAVEARDGEVRFATEEATPERLLYRREPDGSLYVRLDKQRGGKPVTIEFRMRR